MIVYFDTSAVVPMLVAERSSARCIRVWNEALTVISTRLLYVETMAALSQGRLSSRLSEDQLQDRIRRWKRMWGQFQVREFDEHLMAQAGVAVEKYGLRGYDSVHCAAAASLTEGQFLAVSGDRKLLASWREQGVATLDPNAP